MLGWSKKKHSKLLCIFGAAVPTGVFGITNCCLVREKLTALTFIGLYEPNKAIVSAGKQPGKHKETYTFYSQKENPFSLGAYLSLWEEIIF